MTTPNVTPVDITKLIWDYQIIITLIDMEISAC